MRQILPALALVSALGCSNNRVIPDASRGRYQRVEYTAHAARNDQAARRYEALSGIPVDRSCETVRQQLRTYLSGGTILAANRCETEMVIEFMDKSQMRFALNPTDPLACSPKMEVSAILLQTADQAMSITCTGEPVGSWTEFLR